MLTLKAFDMHNKAIQLPDFLSLEMHSEENVPSDLLYIKFPYFENADCIRTIELVKAQKCIFTGICDEVDFEKSASGNFVTITLRDKISLLLDNEALPAMYKNITARVLYDRYIKDLGFDGYIADESCLSGDFLIKKGTSVYEVINAFSKAVYNSSPSVVNNKICFFSNASNEKTVFTNKDYYKIKVTKSPVNLISKVKVKTSEKDFYTTVKCNEFAQSKGVLRQRYIDACNKNTPMVVAFRMMENGNKKYEQYKIYLNEFVDNSILEKCIIDDSFYGKIDNLYISKIINRLSSKGKLAEITLKKEIDYVAS